MANRIRNLISSLSQFSRSGYECISRFYRCAHISCSSCRPDSKSLMIVNTTASKLRIIITGRQLYVNSKGRKKLSPVILDSLRETAFDRDAVRRLQCGWRQTAMCLSGQTTRRELSVWKLGAMGCGVVVILVIVWMGWLAYRISGTVLYRNLRTCRTQMESIGRAMDRYAASNHAYPESLRELVPDYLVTSKVFHCPADSDPLRLFSYTYRQPDADAPGSTVVLVCRNHRLPNGRIIPLQLRKDGRFTAISPRR